MFVLSFGGKDPPNKGPSHQNWEVEFSITLGRSLNIVFFTKGVKDAFLSQYPLFIRTI